MCTNNFRYMLQVHFNSNCNQVHKEHHRSVLEAYTIRVWASCSNNTTEKGNSAHDCCDGNSCQAACDEGITPDPYSPGCGLGHAAGTAKSGPRFQRTPPRAQCSVHLHRCNCERMQSQQLLRGRIVQETLSQHQVPLGAPRTTFTWFVAAGVCSTCFMCQGDTRKTAHTYREITPIPKGSIPDKRVCPNLYPQGE
jgi:hypothetical protein